MALLDGTGKFITSCPADQPCDREGFPPDCGFAIPVPLSWLFIPEENVRFSFQVVETGVTFPEGGGSLRKRRIGGSAAVVACLDSVVIEQRMQEVINGLDPAVPVLVLGIHEMHRTGAPMIALNLARHLAASAGCRVLTLCLDGTGSLQEEFEVLGPVITDVKFLLNNATSKLQQLLAGLRARAYPSAVVNSLSAGNLSIVFEAAGFKVVSLIHEFPFAFEPQWIAEVARASAAVIFPCAEVQAAFHVILRGLPCTTAIQPQGAYMLENAPERVVDRMAVRERLGIAAEEHLVLACGTIDTRKGFDWFTSFVIHFSRHSDLAGSTHFVWLGKAFDQSLFFHGTHSLAASGIGHRFHHLAEIPDPAEVYASADLLVMCSRIDPFPSVVLEAMGFGLPVLGFDHGQGTSGLIRETGFGMVVPAMDMVDSARAIERMLGDRAFRDMVAANAPAFIRGNFRSDIHAGAVLDCMKALADDPSSSP